MYYARAFATNVRKTSADKRFGRIKSTLAREAQSQVRVYVAVTMFTVLSVKMKYLSGSRTGFRNRTAVGRFDPLKCLRSQAT